MTSAGGAAGGRPPSLIHSVERRGSPAPIAVDETNDCRCDQRNVRPSVVLLGVEADDVQVVVDADVEIEAGPAAGCGRVELVEAVVEFLLPARSADTRLRGASYSGTWKRSLAIGATPQRDDSRSVPPPPMNSTRW